MGLLDAFDDDQGRFALGLLAAAGPRADGAGFGQRLQEAMQGVQAGREADLKRKYMQAQMDNYASEIEQRKAAIAKQNLLQEMTQRLLGGQKPAMGSTNLVNDALPPELRIGAQSAIPARGGLSAASLDDITALHAAGGPNLLDAFKYARDGSQRQSGSEYVLPNGRREMGPPSIDKNMMLRPNPQGGYSASLIPGALEAANALAGGNAGAVEAAKAPYQMVDWPDGNGNTDKIPLAEAMRRVQSQMGRSPQPAAPSPAPVAAAVSQIQALAPPARPPAAMLGSRDPAPYEQQIIQTDLAKNGIDPSDSLPPRTNLSGPAVTPQLQAAAPPPVAPQTAPALSLAAAARPDLNPPAVSGRTLSASELALRQQRALAPGIAQAAGDTARAKATADAQVKAVEDSYAKAKSAADSLLAIGQSRQAIAGGVYTGAGAETKLAITKGLQAVGLGDMVDANRVSNTDYLTSTLGTQLLANAKALGSNPTESEGKQLRAIMGTIGKDPQALNRVIDWQESVARRSITDHNSLLDSAQQRGFTPGYEMRVEAPQAQPKAKTATLADIAATARASGRSTAEVTKRLKEKGYTIVGGQP